MGQMGFYDLDKRLEAISAKGDPLELIKVTVPWESFRAEIEAVTRPKPAERKSTAGRKPVHGEFANPRTNGSARAVL